MDISDSPNHDSEIATLVSIIVNAAHVAETRIPAPASPEDDEVPMERRTDPQLRTAIFIIEAACAQLCSLIARPSGTLVNKFLAFFESACLQVALSNKIPDILEEHPSGMHVSELEKRTGVDRGKLGRILHLLATRHVFQEVGDNTFANNHLSSHLISSNPLSSLGLAMTDECFKAASVLSDTLNTPEVSASSRPEDSAFSRGFGVNGSVFDYYSEVAPERGARFGRAMMGWSDAIEAEAIVYEFPWAELRESAIVCDVGGGVGNTSMQLAKHYPTLRLVLQDLPAQIDMAKNEIWPKHCPEAVAGGRIEFVPLDFFNECPRKGCDIYLLKNILHDWGDELSVKILKNVRDAMGTNSRVLVYEFIIQPAYRLSASEGTFTQAPEPLLSNFGEGRIRQCTMDLGMMTMSNSRERSLKDFIKLGDTVGLRYTRLWEVGEMCVMEFVL